MLLKVRPAKYVPNILMLLIPIIGFSLANNQFIRILNLLGMINAFSFVGIVALAQTLIIVSAGIDLSGGGIAALTAITSGFIMWKTPISPSIVVGIGIIIGICCGILNGFVIVKLRIAPIVATLATLEIYYGLAMVITKGYAIYDLPKSIQHLAGLSIGPFQLPLIIFVLAIVATFFLLNHTSVGRYVFSIGGNYTASRICGIPIEKTQMLIYGISGLFSGISGILVLSWIGSGQPTIGQSWLLPSIAAPIIGGASLFGGVGSIVGTVVGIVVLSSLDTGLTMLSVSPYWRDAVMGIIIFFVALLDIFRRKTQT